MPRYPSHNDICTCAACLTPIDKWPGMWLDAAMAWSRDDGVTHALAELFLEYAEISESLSEAEAVALIDQDYCRYLKLFEDLYKSP